MTSAADIHFLQHAARIAQRGLGRTWPNPSVGCVLVKDTTILAATRTADEGRPHAEAQALTIAGDAARGATAYVTLEPCSHHGKTPPCARSLIDAGVARVVYAAEDPDPRVSGQGVAMLQAAGIIVDFVNLSESHAINRGFFQRVNSGMPYVAMKMATTQDNCIADADGNSKWITGPAARAHGHMLRSQFDAIVTGIGTVLADDPLLTARPPARLNPYLTRVICDRRLRLPLTSNLVKTAPSQPTWVITGAEAIEQNASHATDLREAGVKFLVVDDGLLAPMTILKALVSEGVTRAFIEAGTALNTAFMDANLVDTLHWYRAPRSFGNAGKPAIATLDSSLEARLRAGVRETRMLGPDSYERIELH